jgi:hypothetical protein
METFRRLAPYLRFAAELLRYGREPLTLPRAAEQVRDKLARRDAALADLLERHAYGAEPGPYRALLDAAGWTKASVLARLGQVGADATLRELAESGVHITLEEFKGRQPVVRGSRRFTFAESDFDNRHLAYAVEVKSGGTRSAGTSVPITLDFSAALAADTAVMLEQWQLWGHAQAIWLPMGGAAAVAALIYAKLGRPPVRWFSQIRGRDLTGLERWTPYLLSAVTRLGGTRIAIPEFAPPEAAGDIARWMAGQGAARRPVCLTTYASSAVRVAAAATAAGVDLTGCAFITIGEPLTDAKRQVIERSGARLVVRYAMTEAGIIGYACRRPRASDDLHVLETNLAVIPQPVRIGDDTVPALLFTSLLPMAPKVLLNVQSGDYAEMSREPCGCGFEQAGYRLHVSGIRSFEKLTGEGVTFATTNLFQVLEDLLPSKFGGQPTDYQVTEEEGPDGIPRLVLVVSPAVGPVNEAEVKETFLRHLGSNSTARRTSVMWRQAGTLAIRRSVPQATKKGKVQPFHLAPRRSGVGRERVP